MSCGKAFTNNARRHTNESPRHLQQNALGLPGALTASIPKNPILTGRVTCTCGKEFKTDEALEQHQRDASVHAEVNISRPAGEIKCSCGKNVKDEDGLENYLRSSLRRRKFEEFRSGAAGNDNRTFFGFPDDGVVSNFVSFPVWSHGLTLSSQAITYGTRTRHNHGS